MQGYRNVFPKLLVTYIGVYDLFKSSNTVERGGYNLLCVFLGERSDEEAC